MSSEISGCSSEYPSTRSLTSQTSQEESFPVTINLVSAARTNLRFLRDVAVSDWLHHPPTLVEAIRRYEELWMPLISDLTAEHDQHPPMILPPFDVEWVWYCHALNPVQYRKYCVTRFSKVIGKAAIFDKENEEYAVKRCREIWKKRYPNEAFENEVDSEVANKAAEKEGDNDVRDFLMGEMAKFKDLYEKFFWEPYMPEIVYLIAANRRYKKLLQLVVQQCSDGGSCILVPTVDILLMWLTHQSYPTVYAADTQHMEDELLMLVGPWDHSVKEEDIEETKKLWEATFDQPYEKAGGRLAVDLRDGNALKARFHWAVSDSDVNIKYKSLHPRFLLEACLLVEKRLMEKKKDKYALILSKTVYDTLTPRGRLEGCRGELEKVIVFVKLRTHTYATLAEKTGEFLRLQMYRCHKQLKIDKPVSKFPSDSWQKVSQLYCEFGTKGIKLELRHPGSHCFKGTGLIDSVSFMWNDLLRAPSLAFGSEVGQNIRVFTSITPPVQAPYLLKCVPDRVADDSGAMISDVMLKLNQYRPQEGRWLSRTVLDHAGRECFVVRIRIGGGFWRRGAESPETVKWEDRIIEIREGPWSYVAGSTIGKAPDKVVGTAKPKEESEDKRTWCFSTGDKLTIQWESTASTASLGFTLEPQDSNSSVKLLKGRQMQYDLSKGEKRLNQAGQGLEEEEHEFVTVVRFSEENPNGKATALLNWKLLAVEVLPEEDAVFVLLLCFTILRTVSEMRKEDIGGLLIRRRLKEAKLGERDWGSLILDTASCPMQFSSAHLQPWYWNAENAKAVLAHDQAAEHRSIQTSLSSSLAEGGDKLYKRGIIA